MTSNEMSAFHRGQLGKYIKFFRTKRDVQVAEIQELFRDTEETRVEAGSLMGAEEVTDLLRSLGDSVRSNFEQDLRRTVNMSVLAIQQLLEDADAQDIELQMDTSKIEDSHLLDEVENIRFDGPAKEGGQKAGRLVSLRNEQQRIIDQNIRLEKQLQAVTKENEALQDQLDRANQSNSNYMYEVESLRRQLESNTQDIESSESKKSHESDATALQAQLDAERDRVVQLRAELGDARSILLEEHGVDLDDISEAFKNSRQFQQLRKTLTQKTEQLTDLRRRILAYEPDQTRIDQDLQDEPLRVKHK